MKYFLVVGEPSGDSLGAKLIEALKEQDPQAEFHGIGGNLMQAAGMNTLLPMKELTVIGIWEAVMRLPQLMKVRNAIVQEVTKLEPDAVITIDFPDFNFLLQKKLRANSAVKARLIHYVAPTVWAWRPGRAKLVAQFLDAMICLFPFEPDYFKKHKLRSVFVGHPITQDNPAQGNEKNYREMHEVPDNALLLGLFFGSRESEFKNNAQIIKETAIYISEKIDNVHLVIPTLEALEYDVLQLLQDINIPAYVESDQKHKWDAMAACDAAIAVSGTVGLELAYAGVPHVIVYKTHPLTFLIVRLLAKVKYAHLANIILGNQVVPEFLQFNCKPEKVSAKVLELLASDEEANKQKSEMTKIRDVLDNNKDERPSMRAAKYIIKLLNDSGGKKSSAVDVQNTEQAKKKAG